jgi:amino acid adenylation domain-containing protein
VLGGLAPVIHTSLPAASVRFQSRHRNHGRPAKKASGSLFVSPPLFLIPDLPSKGPCEFSLHDSENPYVGGGYGLLKSKAKVALSFAPRHMYLTYPLSPMQAGMLFNSIYSPDSGVDIEQVICDLNEDLSAPAMESAWQAVIARHAVLRTTFEWEGLQHPRQSIHESVPFAIEQENLRGSAPEAQEVSFQTILHRERFRGFDLSQLPLMRVQLVQFAPMHWRMIWSFHHALLDGRSFFLLLKELFTFYEAGLYGREVALPSPCPYYHFIHWVSKADWSGSEHFWRNALAGLAAPTPLRVDKPAPSLPEPPLAYGELVVTLSQTVSSALDDLAASHGLTLNTFVQGAWGLLLNRYNGEDEVLFGATRAGRKSTVAGAESMIGLFINTLPVRAGAAPNTILLDYLKDLRAQQLRLREHEHTPLSQLQPWSGLPGSQPLFESLVVYEHATLDTLLRAQGGAWLNRHFRVIDQTNFPLSLFAYGEPEMLLRLSYNRHRFTEDTIKRLGGHLQTILTSMASGLEKRICDVPLLTESERQQVVVEWNDNFASFPNNRCIHHLFEEQVKQSPEGIALVFGTQQLTYCELDSRANGLARYLQDAGVTPETPVGVCTNVSPEMVIGLLAILKAGGTYVPLDPAYPQDRLAFMLEDAQIPLVLTQSSISSLLSGSSTTTETAKAAPKLLLLDSVLQNLESTHSAPASPVAPENLAYILYTSGSTGRPKGVMVTHRNVVNFFTGMDQCLGTKPGVWLAVTSISFDISVLELFWTLARGFKVILQNRSGDLVAGIGQGILAHQVTHFQCTPSLASMLVRDAATRQALRSLRKWLLGGEPLSTELAAQMEISGEILNMYGPTETTVWSATHVVNKSENPIPIGRPLANTQIYILDQQLQPVPIGVAGELFIGGAGVARGYLNRPELTKEMFISHPFLENPTQRLYRTGDRARYRADGTIEFIGRMDFQVKLRGFRVELGEIEAALRQSPEVREAVVMMHRFAEGDQRLVGYIVSATNSPPLPQALQAFLRQKLPEHMVPFTFVFLDALPLTPNGKINRKGLPPPDTQSGSARSDSAPRSATEQTLAEIWRVVLGRHDVGLYDNFFDLGGHSLLATRLVSLVREQLDKGFSVVELFRHPTIHALAQSLNQQVPAAKPFGKTVPQQVSRRQFRLPKQRLYSTTAPLEPL